MKAEKLKKRSLRKGQNVFIIWKNPDYDWHWFVLLDFSDKWKWIYLQGRDSPHGKSDESKFWVRAEEISTISEHDISDH